MWKTVYIANDIVLANNLKKNLKNNGIQTVLNTLDIGKDELDGNVEILVPKTEIKEALDIINKVLIYENILLEDLD